MSVAKSLVLIQWVGLVLLILGVLTQRYQLLPFKVAFGSFALALLVLSVVALVSLIVLGLSFGPISNAARSPSMLAFVLGFIPLVLVITIVGSGFKVPRIHNISTNPDLELRFVHAQSLRKPGENSIEPPSERVVAQQKAHYKDLAPLTLHLSKEEAFEKSIEVMQAFGWEITYRDAEQGHLEAVERTALFGFADDILVKIVESDPNAEGEQKVIVNLRSVSRVGVSDLGANAKRIQKFQKALLDSRN